jgi:hypothetical protein
MHMYKLGQKCLISCYQRHELGYVEQLDTPWYDRFIHPFPLRAALELCTA